MFQREGVLVRYNRERAGTRRSSETTGFVSARSRFGGAQQHTEAKLEAKQHGKGGVGSES